MKTKGYLFFVMLSFSIVGLLSCNNKPKQELLDSSLIENPNSMGSSESGDLPVLEFQDTVHNFENIFSGEVVSYTFKFKNTGKSDLIISDAKASCGCTVPEFSGKPVAPGDEGFIKVSFDSKGKQGMQKKYITVMSNAVPNKKQLVITGYIVSE